MTVFLAVSSDLPVVVVDEDAHLCKQLHLLLIQILHVNLGHASRWTDRGKHTVIQLHTLHILVIQSAADKVTSKCCEGVCCTHLWSCVCCGAGRCRVWARAAGLFTLTSSSAADLRTAHNSRAMSALRSDQSQPSSTNTPSHHALPAALLLSTAQR